MSDEYRTCLVGVSRGWRRRDLQSVFVLFECGWVTGLMLNYGRKEIWKEEAVQRGVKTVSRVHKRRSTANTETKDISTPNQRNTGQPGGYNIIMANNSKKTEKR